MLWGALCIGVFFSAFFLIGAGLLWVGIRARQKAEASQGWPATQGQIIHTDVLEVKYRDDTSGMGVSGSGWKVRVSYLPKVEYEYQVLGQTYTGSRLAFGAEKGYYTRQQAEEAIARYPEGAPVTVYYNPENPAEAVLERKANHSLVLILAGASFLLLAGCVLLPLMLIVLQH